MKNGDAEFKQRKQKNLRKHSIYSNQRKNTKYAKKLVFLSDQLTKTQNFLGMHN